MKTEFLTMSEEDMATLFGVIASVNREEGKITANEYEAAIKLFMTFMARLRDPQAIEIALSIAGRSKKLN